MSPYDRPSDEELGLSPESYWGPNEFVELRCGCAIYPSDTRHDVDDCLEQQADELAYEEDLRHQSPWGEL
jgi:hypothetical protein